MVIMDVLLIKATHTCARVHFWSKWLVHNTYLFIQLTNTYTYILKEVRQEHFVRLQIDIDLAQLLKNALLVKRLGSSIFANVEYENLLDYYYCFFNSQSKSTGHFIANCISLFC